MFFRSPKRHCPPRHIRRVTGNLGLLGYPTVRRAGGPCLVVWTPLQTWVCRCAAAPSRVKRRAPDRTLTPRHHLAVLGQKVAQTVDPRGAELHKLLAIPVEHRDRLLLLALRGTGPDGEYGTGRYRRALVPPSGSAICLRSRCGGCFICSMIM